MKTHLVPPSVSLLVFALSFVPLSGWAQPSTSPPGAAETPVAAPPSAPAPNPVPTPSFVEAAFKKVKLGGYIQARFTDVENSGRGLDPKGAPLVKDGFTVRRARLKASYSGEWSGAMLQIDANPRGVILKDAEVHLIEPWTGYRFTLIAGQTKWPFGYEVVQSSADREFPERARVVRAFAPGERDRGAKVQGAVDVFRFSAGVFDGTGIESKPFPGVDSEHHKDVVGRVGVDFKTFAAGVSGWWGRALDPFNSVLVPRTRVGADAQLKLALLPLGDTALKGEFIRGETYSVGGLEQYGVLAHGYYLLLVQNFGKKDALAFRYDYFDPMMGTPTVTQVDGVAVPSPYNGVSTWGVTALHQWDDSLKLSVSYEVPTTATTGAAQEPKDSIFTVQMQGRF